MFQKITKPFKIILVVVFSLFIIAGILFGGIYFYYYNSTCSWFWSGCQFNPSKANGSRYISDLRERYKKDNSRYKARSASDTGKTLEQAKFKEFVKTEKAELDDFAIQINKVSKTTDKAAKNNRPIPEGFMPIYLDLTFWNNSSLDYNRPEFYVKDDNGYRYQPQTSLISPEYEFISPEDRIITSEGKVRGELVFLVKKDFGSLKLYAKIEQEEYRFLVINLGKLDELEYTNPQIDNKFGSILRYTSELRIGETKKLEPFEMTVLEAQRIKFQENTPEKQKTLQNQYGFNPNFDQIKVKAKIKNTSPHTLKYETNGFLQDQTGRSIPIGRDSSNVSKGKYGDLKAGEEVEVEIYFDGILPEKTKFKIVFWPYNYLKEVSILVDLGEI